jgi:5-methylcytosine-specific restriction enzyme A
MYLSEHPLCECDECKAKGLLTPANVVDHIQTVRDRPDLRLEWSNLRAMAKRCHDRHTARGQGFGRKAPGGGKNSGAFP